VDVFQVEQISSKKSDWVKPTSHSFFELVTKIHQLV